MCVCVFVCVCVCVCVCVFVCNICVCIPLHACTSGFTGTAVPCMKRWELAGTGWTFRRSCKGFVANSVSSPIESILSGEGHP